MTEPLIATTPAELAEFGWDAESQDRPAEFTRPLLSCGHYDVPVFNSSSQWDFPHDPRICPTCGEERQWDVRVQALIMETWR